MVREGFLEEVSFELRLKDSRQQKQNVRKYLGFLATEWSQNSWRGRRWGQREPGDAKDSSSG